MIRAFVETLNTLACKIFGHRWGQWEESRADSTASHKRLCLRCDRPIQRDTWHML